MLLIPPKSILITSTKLFSYLHNFGAAKTKKIRHYGFSFFDFFCSPELETRLISTSIYIIILLKKRYLLQPIYHWKLQASLCSVVKTKLFASFSCFLRQHKSRMISSACDTWLKIIFDIPISEIKNHVPAVLAFLTFLATNSVFVSENYL